MTTRQKREIERMRRHREDLTLAITKGWPLERARAHMNAMRESARRAAIEQWRTGKRAVSAPIEAPETPRYWWQRD